MMRSAPPKLIDRVLALLFPPACREEVLGDLYEACDSSGQYIREALCILPLVIFRRIRRSADPQLLLMQAAVVYLSFMGAAWYEGKTFLFADLGLWKLAIPPAWVLVGLLVEDVYACPGSQSFFKQMRGPLLGFGFAYLSQIALSMDNLLLALPQWVMFFGSAAGLLFSIGLQFLIAPAVDRPLRAGVPAFWLKRTNVPLRMTQRTASIAGTLALLLLLAAAAGQLGGRWLMAALIVIPILLLVWRELRGKW
jgi:hypothetical protein